MANKKYSLHYYDNHSILLVNSSGIIRQLFTPFKVRCDVDVGRHTAGSYLYVDEVAPGDKDELIYHIGDGAYYHKHFRIIANF
jgi:hypothetical protein